MSEIDEQVAGEFTQSPATEPIAASDSDSAETTDESAKADAAQDDAAKTPRWYIVHTYSGFEQRVQKTINELMRTGQDEGLIAEVIVPTEKVVEVNRVGQKRTITRKSYPGYVLVRMIMTDLSWHLIQSIPKVTGFIGGKNRPAPMRDSEAQHILDLMKSSQDTPRPNFNYQRGEEVKVKDGPFMGFNAVVQEANYEKGKLTVSVTIFGRQTPTELDFSQVTRG
ncbi:MAG: transcription termination/antitermination protein NusG [Desulfovibrionaceae bacterium]|nr:transcription termination/antitermination protein NusG [Desulfovibrionaceae bacterium]